MHNAIGVQITDCTNNGHYSRCGGCCSSLLPVSDEELQVMKSYADQHGIQPKLPDIQNFIYLKCPFLDPDGHACMIYTARPTVCRSFQCNLNEMENGITFLKLWKKPCVPSVKNLWELYGLTGIRTDGVDVTPENAGKITLYTDKGTIFLQDGKPIHPIMNSGKEFAPGLILAVQPEGLYFSNGHSGVIFLRYEDIQDLK